MRAQQRVGLIVIRHDVQPHLDARLAHRDAQVELLEGVSAGDRVVTAGIRVQRDGQPVRVVGGAAAPAAAAMPEAAPAAVPSGGTSDGKTPPAPPKN